MNYLSFLLYLALILNLTKSQIIFPEDDEEDNTDLESRVGRCPTYNRQWGQCVFINQCAPLDNLIKKKPLQQSDINILRASYCGRIRNEVLVCCPQDNVQPNQPPVNPNPISPSVPQQPTGGCNALPTVCGRGLEHRIFGGNRTKIDEYPWMALLEYTKPGNQKGFHCGGVLINDRHVLTAAHCLKHKAIPPTWSMTGVRLGEWDTSSTSDCEDGECSDPVVDIPISKAMVHEQYNPNAKNQLHDIAVLRLARVVKFTSWISPICLPSAPHLRSAQYEGVSMDVAGWGKTESASASNVKLKARVNGVSLPQCNSVYSRNKVSLENSQVCAGGEKGIDSCNGDSGGPLIAFNKQNTALPYYYLVGVVSFGPKSCGQEGWPGVYTNVASYIDWISKQLCA